DVIDDGVCTPLAQVDVSRRVTGRISIADYRHDPPFGVLRFYPRALDVDCVLGLWRQNGASCPEINGDGLDGVKIIQPIDPVVGSIGGGPTFFGVCWRFSGCRFASVPGW